MVSVENNEYKYKIIIKNIIERNRFLQRFVKPLMKKIAHQIPQPRDFLLNNLPPNPICCEVGVWKGEFSKRIIQVAKPKKLYLIDPWKYFGEDYFYNREQPEQKFMQEAQDMRYEMVKESFANELSSNTVEIIRGTSDEAASKFEDEIFDFVYIDGNHSYDFVKQDITTYYKKTKPNGIVAGDDYRMKDVQRAVQDFVKENSIKNFSVKNDQFIIKKS
ncbi:MAG: hypothetical protein ACI9BF_000169 [Candidatus Paceibacteria bacterium]|jgi:hypothetical protein